MEVGLAVGGRVASTIISKLINELIEYAKDQKKMQLGLKDELARLEKTLPKIQAVVNIVDQGLIREENPSLEKWLWQLRDAADQADDVMDEIKYNYEKERVEAEKTKVKKSITNFRTFFLRAVDKDPFLKRLKEAVKTIDEVAADVAEFYMLVKDLVKDQKEMVKSAISSRETSSVLNLGTHVFGRKKEKEDIIKKLLNPDCKTKGKNFVVLPIIGVGGVGKTTLVQVVYNDPIVEKHFELRLWVCISNNFDVVLLTKKLYESVFGQRADFDSFDLMQKKIKEKLEATRFLVVFDDVWNDNNKQDWEKLIAPLKYGKNGSMMLLTTRMKTAATLTGPNLMDSIILEGLNERPMWDLFKECAFGGEDPDYHKELVEIGRCIVKKLKGSPLAAKTVGGILCSHLNEVHWTCILQSELWSLEQGPNDIMPALRLTYQYLPPFLKPCFSFCSIFSQDHVFRKHDLINMWIALGMVPQIINGTMRPEDVGSNYFDYMISKSIFIRPNQVFDTFEEFCFYPREDEFVMHDLIHDLSVLVSQGECLRTSTEKLVFVPNTVRHLYARIDGPCQLSISGLKNLRTLILDIDESHQPEQDSIVTEMLKGMESLRLLILVAHNLNEYSESASKLLHLRYLSLSLCRNSTFLKSFSRLYLLETMVCDDFLARQLKQADDLSMLINLRNLIAPESFLDRVAGIGRLTSLQELSFSVGKNSGIKICELSDMIELRVLRINKIENVGRREEVIEANLRNKINLNELSLTWTPKEPNRQANEDVLDYLQPHSGLKVLTIRSYEGTGRSPLWFRTQALSKLVHLTIHDCNFEHLPCLEELPLLKYIDFCDMCTIKRIIHECNLSSSAVNAFPSLERLSFDGMRAINEWCLAKQPNKWMQCLRYLNVSDCPKLQDLPPVPVGVKELRFKDLGLNPLPNLWNDQSSKVRSLPLVVLSIRSCKNLVSLTEGFLQNHEQFVALEELYISKCEKLIYLPQGGFNKFISLKELDVSDLPDVMVQEECFLPSALQKLSISSCGHLDTILPKALESVHSLIKLELSDCANITSLPPKEVFSRWKTLKRLALKDCPVLASLESLLGLSYIEYLEVRGCPKLSQAIPSPLLLKEDETEREKGDKLFSECSSGALAFFQSLLCTLFYLVLRMFMPKLKGSASTQPQPPSPSSANETGKISAQEKSLFFVYELVIDDPILLSVEPIRSLSAVKKLSILDCLQSLPELPLVLQELYINDWCPELQTRCEKSGPDWPKLSQIPEVTIGSKFMEYCSDDFVDDHILYLAELLSEVS